MNKEEFSKKCKELVDMFASAVLEYVGDKYTSYMSDDMFLADISLCFTGNPSAGEAVTLRRFVVQVGMYDTGHTVEGFADKDGTLRAEDMPVTFDDILEDNHGE